MAYVVNVKYSVVNDLLEKMGKTSTFIHGHTIVGLRKQLVWDAVTGFAHSADFSARLDAALSGLGKGKVTDREVTRVHFKYKVNTEEGREWASKELERDDDVMQVVAHKWVVYADITVKTDPAASEKIKCSLARDESDKMHDSIYARILKTTFGGVPLVNVFVLGHKSEWGVGEGKVVSRVHVRATPGR